MIGSGEWGVGSGELCLTPNPHSFHSPLPISWQIYENRSARNLPAGRIRRGGDDSGRPFSLLNYGRLGQRGLNGQTDSGAASHRSGFDRGLGRVQLPRDRRLLRRATGEAGREHRRLVDGRAGAGSGGQLSWLPPPQTLRPDGRRPLFDLRTDQEGGRQPAQRREGGLLQQGGESAIL